MNISICVISWSNCIYKGAIHCFDLTLDIEFLKMKGVPSNILTSVYSMRTVYGYECVSHQNLAISTPTRWSLKLTFELLLQPDASTQLWSLSVRHQRWQLSPKANAHRIAAQFRVSALKDLMSLKPGHGISKRSTAVCIYTQTKEPLAFESK